MTQIITSRGGGSGGGGASYTAGNGIDIQNNEISIDTSVVQTTGNMVCDLTGADDTHYPSAKAVSDALSCAGAGDMMKSVYDPNNCCTDAFNYNNMYNKLTAGSGINLTANAISTASNFGTSSTAAATAQKEVSIPGITSLNVGQVVHILPTITSTVANSTLKVNNFDAYPMRYNNAAITTSTDSIVRPANIVTTFVFDGTYWQFMGHGLDSNTTYSNMSAAEAVTGTCASARTISACNLKCAINTHAPISSSAYGSGWCGSASAPTQDAVYAKVSTIDELIPSEATCSNQLADKNYVNDGINSVTAYYITKNAAGDQFATHSELVNAGTYYSGGAVRVPTRNDYAIVLDDETHDDEVTRYIYNSGWEYQYTINESPLTTAQINALNSGITATKVSCYDCCMAQCCDIPTDNCQLCNGCGYVTSAAIPTDNCQLANGCGYTTCTGTITGICMNGCSCGTSGVVDLGTVTGDAKVFAISDLTSAASLTTATQAYDWAYTNGKMAIILHNGGQYVYEYGSSTSASFSRSRAYGAVNSSNWAYVYSLVFTVASGSVTAISTKTNYINLSNSTPPIGTSNNTITLVI